jgi:hypothetical protein
VKVVSTADVNALMTLLPIPVVSLIQIQILATAGEVLHIRSVLPDLKLFHFPCL